MKCTTILAVVLMVCARPVLPAESLAEQERQCRAHLEKLAEGIKSYRLLHDGKGPPKLSDLYYESYADDVTLYACPSVEGSRLMRTEIDEKSDYTLEPLVGQPALLVRERAPHHGNDKTVLAALEDGTIKALPLDSSGGKVAANQVATKKPENKPEPPVLSTKRPKTDDPDVKVTFVDPGLLGKGGGGPVVPADGDPRKSLPPGAVITEGKKPPAGFGVDDQTSREDAADRQRQGASALRGVMDAQQSLVVADTIYKEGGYDAALEFYERVLDSDPKNEHALLGAGRSSMRVGGLRVAKIRFKNVLSQRPDHLEARRLIATIDLVLGDTKAATAAADALYREQPNDADVATLHAQTSLYAGNDAAALFASVAKSQPKAAAEHSKLAGSYMDQRLWRLALLHYRTAAALDPNDGTSFLNSGMAAAKLGDKKLARSIFEDFLRRNPADPIAPDVKEQLDKVK